MLSYLRLKSRSWMIKAILATMAVGLTFFFGYSDFRQASDQASQVAATVNGEPILVRHYEQVLEENRGIYSNIYGGKIPSFLEKIVRQNALDQLIERSLLIQWAKKEQIPVARQEVAHEIRDNPQLQNDGKFNAEFYKTRFRPGFKRIYGIDFEEAIEQDLALKKLSNWVIEGLTAAPGSPRLAEDLDAHHYHFKRVVIDPKALPSQKMDAEEASSPNPLNPAEEAERLAEEVRREFHDDEKVKTLLQPYALSIENLTDRSLNSWEEITAPGAEGFAVMRELLRLGEDNPIPAKVYRIDEKWYVYKWVARTKASEPEPAPPGELDSEKTAVSSLLQNAFLKALRDDAQVTVEISL